MSGPWSVGEIVPLLLEGGRVALHYFQHGRWWLKPDRTLVTPADGEIEALLARQFDCPERGRWMLGEETADHKGEPYIRDLLAGDAWVVDPIDGTAPFAHGLAYWGISIGFMRAGRLCEGAVYLPKQGELFMSDGDRVLFAAGVEAQADVSRVDLQPLRVPGMDLDDGVMIALSQVMAKRGRFRRQNPVQVTGCAVNSLAYLLLGRYAAYVAHLKLWDLAGAWPLLRKTGFAARFYGGAPLTDRVDAAAFHLAPDDPQRWTLADECIFARPQHLDALQAAVNFVPE